MQIEKQFCLFVLGWKISQTHRTGNHIHAGALIRHGYLHFVNLGNSLIGIYSCVSPYIRGRIPVEKEGGTQCS